MKSFLSFLLGIVVGGLLTFTFLASMGKSSASREIAETEQIEKPVKEQKDTKPKNEVYKKIKGARYFDHPSPFECNKRFKINRVIADYAAIADEQEEIIEGHYSISGLEVLLYDTDAHFYDDQIIEVEAVDEIGRFSYYGDILPILQPVR